MIYAFVAKIFPLYISRGSLCARRRTSHLSVTLFWHAFLKIFLLFVTLVNTSGSVIIFIPEAVSWYVVTARHFGDLVAITFFPSCFMHAIP